MAHRFLRRGPLAVGLIWAGLRVVAADGPVVPTDNGASPPPTLPMAVPATDPNVWYVGRFSTENSVASFEWPATAITLRFHGTAANGQLALGKNRAEVIVDGQPVKVLTATAPGMHLYALADGLPDADHTVTIFKATESMVGMAQFAGFQLDAGASVLPAPAPTRAIEVIGDSISAGYGDEATDRHAHFSPDTENAYWTYGAETASNFGADYVCIAWSGKWLWPERALPDIYDRTLPTQADSTWTPGDWKPDVVLINLGTNDFAHGIPVANDWVRAYHKFIDHVRQNDPNATLYLAIGPMLGDEHPVPGTLTAEREDVRRVVQECNQAGDAKVHFIEFPHQDGTLGYGADGHPNLATQAAMAAKWTAAIQADLGWTPAAAAPSLSPPP